MKSRDYKLLANLITQEIYEVWYQV